MKRIVLLLVLCILLTGCGKLSEKDVIKSIRKEFDKSSGYKLEGELIVTNNDEVYNYNVEVLYKKKDYYKVIFNNTSNDHTQIILKNKDGVYVLTPSLNKSFKFQSDWPYNNSQIYLLDTIISDIEKDNKRKYIVNDKKYIFNTKVNYSNNTKLDYQKIVFSKDLELEKVVVFDKNGVESMKFSVNKIKYSPKFKKDEYNINTIIDTNTNIEETSKLEDIIYPLFIPSGTKLVNEEKIDKTNGKRVIMSYDGEKSFTLVEESTDVFNEFTIIPTMGEPCLLMDTLGVINDNSLYWTSGGVDYYLISDVLNQTELLEVAGSINGIVSMK